MPIFEYRCQMCMNDFELLIRNSGDHVECPSCGASDVKKKFSTFGFRSAGAQLASASSSCGGCSSRNCGGCHH